MGEAKRRKERIKQARVLPDEVHKHVESSCRELRTAGINGIEQVWAGIQQGGGDDPNAAAAAEEVGGYYASAYSACALFAMHRLQHVSGADDLLATAVSLVIEQLKRGVPWVSPDQRFKASGASQVLVALAVKVFVDENKGTEYSDPRYAASGVLAELCKFLISAKLAPDEIMEMVNMTVGIMNDPRTIWEGKPKAESRKTLLPESPEAATHGFEIDREMVGKLGTEVTDCIYAYTAKHPEMNIPEVLEALMSVITFIVSTRKDREHREVLAANVKRILPDVLDSATEAQTNDDVDIQAGHVH